MKGKGDADEKRLTWKDLRIIIRKIPETRIGRVFQTLLFLAVFIASASGLTRFFVRASWREIFFLMIFIAVIVLLVILKIISKRAERVIEGAFNYNWLFVKWMFISLTPIYFFYLAVAPLIIKAPKTWLRWVAIVAGGLLLAAGSLAVITENHRERVLPWLQRRVGKFAPVVYSVDLLVMAISFFSSVTYVLMSNHYVNLSDPRQAAISVDSVQLFYFWHFFQALPLLKINETLQWQTPLTYEGGAVGPMLLLFQLMVIVPVIATFVWYWKRVEPQRKNVRKRRTSGQPYFQRVKSLKRTASN